MITTAVIAFREFFEAFLIIGIFLGVSKKLNLKKEKEIWIAALGGVLLSLFLSTGVYLLGDSVRGILTERNADVLEGYLMIFSGIFIAYVSFSLHTILQKNRNGTLMMARKKLHENAFDISLFFTIVFLVMREGFEIALFTASVSLFSAFLQNFIGLILGFVFAASAGLMAVYAYSKFPIGKVFRATEYMIVLLGASLTQRGITELLETHMDIDLSRIFPFHLSFLPGGDTLVGHMLQGFFGIDQELSLARLLIAFTYIVTMYVLFIRTKKYEAI